MGAGLQKQLVPIFNGGGINTKVDPRLVPAGELLELENMYMLRTGELRLRNGFSILTPSVVIGAKQIFPALGGGLGVLYEPSGSGSSRLTKYLTTPAVTLDIGEGLGIGSVPLLRAVTTPLGSFTGIFAVAASDMQDGDVASLSTGTVASFLDGSDITTWRNRMVVGNGSSNSLAIGSTQFPNASNDRPLVVATGGTTYFCAFYADQAATPALRAVVSTGNSLNYYTLAAAAISAAQSWIDAKPIPGGNTIAVAYRATGGGVTCGIFDPATGTFTSTVNTAGADASFCLGFLDDLLATGNMYLATAGSASGVVVRTMSAANMVVSATHIIDATATVGVRQITGYINSSATNYVVLWSTNGTSTIYDKTMYAKYVAGVVTKATLAGSLSLYSKAGSVDGRYVAMFAYDSSVQPTYVALDISQNRIDSGCPMIMTVVFPGEAGGRRVAASSLSGMTQVGNTIACALPKRTKATLTSAASSRVMRLCTLIPVYSITAQGFTQGIFNSRELGGTQFFPGGMISQNDGVSDWRAAFPFYPEAPSSTIGSVGGAMTLLGTYQYRLVLRTTDRTGRAIRSAGSVPVSVTLTGAQNQVQLIIPNPHLGLNNIIPAPTVEVYRAGPAAAGATTYNKVGELLNNNQQSQDTISFLDTMSDAIAATGELPYFTGGVLENFCPPSCNLMEVNGGRLGLVNSEDATEFWPSKEYKAGAGIGFYPDTKIRVTGDGYGGITAVAAMDGRWILFKSQAIYVISGDGPNDLAQGSFNAPQAVSLSIGTVLPGSVVPTPEGIMFQAAAGVYLLDRGLGLTYVGAPVEKYTLAENIVGASLVTGVTQVRFVMASGRCLVWDYHHKHWYTFKLRVVDANGVTTTITSCSNVSTGWCYALATGYVMQETPGVFSDVSGGSTVAIVPRIGLPQANLAGINGFQRIYGIAIEGEYVGDHTLQVSAVYDLGVATEPTRTKAITAGPYQYEVLFASPKCSTIQINLTASLAAGSGAFRLSGVSLIVGLKRSTVIPYTKRLT